MPSTREIQIETELQQLQAQVRDLAKATHVLAMEIAKLQGEGSRTPKARKPDGGAGFAQFRTLTRNVTAPEDKWAEAELDPDE